MATAVLPVPIITLLEPITSLLKPIALPVEPMVLFLALVNFWHLAYEQY